MEGCIVFHQLFLIVLLSIFDADILKKLFTVQFGWYTSPVFVEFPQGLASTVMPSSPVRALRLELLLDAAKVCYDSWRKNTVRDKLICGFDDPSLTVPLRNFLSWRSLYNPSMRKRLRGQQQL